MSILKLEEGTVVRLAYVVVSVQHKHTIYLKTEGLSLLWGQSYVFLYIYELFSFPGNYFHRESLQTGYRKPLSLETARFLQVRNSMFA